MTPTKKRIERDPNSKTVTVRIPKTLWHEVAKVRAQREQERGESVSWNAAAAELLQEAIAARKKP